MKNKRSNIGLILLCFIMFSLMSASISFYIARGKQNQKERLEEKIAAGIVKEERKFQEEMNIGDLFKDIEEVWLESIPGAAEAVEVDGEDLIQIMDFFKTTEMEKVTEFDEDNFTYIIHMKSKSTRIYVAEQQIKIEQIQGVSQYFEVEDQRMETLHLLLEQIYMKRYNASVSFKEADSAFIEARDENRKWIVDKNEMPNLLKTIELLAPLPKDKFKEIPVQYPDYYISITSRERTYGITLISEKILAVESPDSFSYYQYNPQLWEYVSKKMPIKPTENPRAIASLLRSTKVVVKDAQNAYNFEDQTYYPVEIPRWILKCSLKKVEKLPEEERWAFMMTFTVGREKRDLKVYQDHIIYQDQVYYSSKIAESVRSIFDAQ